MLMDGEGKIKDKGGLEIEETAQRSNPHRPFIDAKEIKANKCMSSVD